MAQPTNTTGGNIRQVLPAGLSIQVSQTMKTYAWNHATTIGEGDPTLNGLLKFTPEKAALPTLASPKMKGLGDPTADEAKAISQNYSNLPAILQGMGRTILDGQREAFIKKASQAKAELAKAYNGKTVPAAEMARYDGLVNQLQFKGVEVVVRGFTVTRDNPKGSRQRKSDGMYVTERVLRRVTIDRPLSDSELQQTLDLITGALIKSMTRAAEYAVRYNGKDANGNNVINVFLTSGVTTTTARPGSGLQRPPTNAAPGTIPRNT